MHMLLLRGKETLKQKKDSIDQKLGSPSREGKRSNSSSEKAVAVLLTTVKQRRKLLSVQGVSPTTLWRMLLLVLVAILVLLLLSSRELVPLVLSIQDSLLAHIPITSFHLILQGIFIGLSVAVPIGPVSIFCMQRTLSKGTLHGLASGLGNSLAIALYSSVAGFGVMAVSAFLLHQQGWLHLIGGVFLAYLGFKIMRTKPVEQTTSIISYSLGKEILSTFLLSVVNPVTILLFAAAFTSMSFENTENIFLSETLVTLGVLLGSFFWRCISTAGISLLGNKIVRGTQWMVWINSLSGGVLFVLGGITLLSLLKSPL